MNKQIIIIIFLFTNSFCFSQSDGEIPAAAPVQPVSSPEVNTSGAWESFNRAESKKSANKLDDAIVEYDKALSINPDFYQAAISRGGAKFLKYDFQGALNDYDIAIQIIENLTQTYGTRSEIKNVLGDTQGSVSELDALNKLKPYLAEAYYRRGSVKKFLSDKSGSCTDFTKAMEMGYPKAETSMKQYCGYVSPESVGGAKGGGASKTAKSEKPKNIAASDTTKSPDPEKK